MPSTLSRRIALAFIGLSLATWLALGATLFVVLRGLHGEATTARLTAIAAPLVAQARLGLANGSDARTILSALGAQVEGTDVGVHLELADGRIIGLGGDTAALEGLAIDPAAARGAIERGTHRASDGTTYAWVASVLRNAGARGPRALIVATQDRSGAETLRDLLAALPGLILVTILVGVPIAWLLSRSVTAPLRRLASATRDLPSAPAVSFEPLPLAGPAEVRELTARFDAMRAELGETRRRESELLANLRHDLRTPLTVISGFAQALVDGTARGDDAARAAGAIAEEADRIDGLVGELEAIERLRTDGGALRPETLDVGELVARAAERFRATAESASIELSVVGSPGPVLTADRVAVERILANLVSNALASAGSAAVGPAGTQPRGHVWLEARGIAGTAAGGPSVAISVTDNGPGFPPGAAERAFDRFYRADPARTGPGSGLGLAIVRELTLAHGGSVHAENVAPHGARVSVVLPVLPGLVRDGAAD